MTILVPIDIYDDPRALVTARRIADLTGERIILFNWAPDESESLAAKIHLDALAADLPAGTTIEVVVTDDTAAAPAIVAAAARAGATICMSTHGRTGLGHALLGSVAEQTMRLGGGPMILVGPHATGDGPRATRPKLVVTVDGSPLSETALPVARDWATRVGMRVEVVQVLDFDAARGADGNDVAETAYVARVARELHAPGSFDYDVLHGEPADAIVEHVRDGAEMVVMATHGRGGFARAVLGSVAMRVVHRATCPVLVVRARA